MIQMNSWTMNFYLSKYIYYTTGIRIKVTGTQLHTLHGVRPDMLRFTFCVSQLSPVAFQSSSYCSHVLWSNCPELLTSGTVSLRVSARLQPQACFISVTAGIRHQCSGVKPWNTTLMSAPENGSDTRQSIAKMRFWQRPKVPTSSSISSKVVITPGL